MRRLPALLGVLAIALCAGVPAASASPIKHVFVIVLENKQYEDAFGPFGLVNAPYLSRTLPSKGVLVPRYYGIGHNSLDNYIAMVSGQPPTPQTKNDCPDPLTSVGTAAVQPYNLAAGAGCTYPDNFKSIADQLASAGLTWRGYNEGIPAPCSMAANGDASHGGTDPNYARKHNPFVFFDSLRESGQCQANDVGLDQLPIDLASESTTPNLAFIVPDQCNDGHSACPSTFPFSNPVTDDQDALRQADAWLQVWVPKILASPAMKHGLLIVTFDEGLEMTACCHEQPGPADPAPGSYAAGTPGPGGGRSGTLMISPWITPGSISLRAYNHYSLLRSLEDNFKLPHLGYAGQTGLRPFGKDIFSAK